MKLPTGTPGEQQGKRSPAQRRNCGISLGNTLMLAFYCPKSLGLVSISTSNLLPSASYPARPDSAQVYDRLEASPGVSQGWFQGKTKKGPGKSTQMQTNASARSELRRCGCDLHEARNYRSTALSRFCRNFSTALSFHSPSGLAKAWTTWRGSAMCW